VAIPPPPTLEPDVAARWVSLLSRLCGSTQAAGRALRPLTLRAAGWRAVDRWHGSEDELLCRAWLERPALVSLGELTIDPGAGPLARVLAYEPSDRWVVWALVHLGGWSIDSLSRLGARQPARLRADLADTRCLLRSQSQSDILLAASDPVQREQIERTLTDGGHVVSARTASREELLTYATPSDIDLIVTDLDRPGRPLDASIATAIAARFSAPQVLLITNRTAPGAASVPGGCTLLAKPADPVALLDRCAEAVLGAIPDVSVPRDGDRSGQV